MAERMKINGVELAFELTGNGHETVVFLNGIAMSIVHWKLFAEALSSYRCLAHDFRGQILSGRPTERYTLAGQAEDLWELLKTLGIDRVHVVGTSYGSAVGFFLCLAHPEAVSSMVVIDGADGVDPLLRAVLSCWRAAALASPRAFYRSLIPWTYSAAWIEKNEAFLTERGGDRDLSGGLLHGLRVPLRRLRRAGRRKRSAAHRLPHARARGGEGHPHPGVREENRRGHPSLEIQGDARRGSCRGRRGSGAAHRGDTRLSRRAEPIEWALGRQGVRNGHGRRVCRHEVWKALLF